jgi:ABC-type sugar transport system permease subunit
MKKKHRQSRWRTWTGYLFISPFLIGVAFIFLPSLIESFIYSFHDVKIELVGMVQTLAGWENYRYAFLVDPDYRVLLVNGARGMVVDTILIMIFSFFVANILNQKFIGRSFARTVFFLPVILATGIVASITDNADIFNPMAITTTTTGQFGQAGLTTLFSLRTFLYQVSLNDTVSTAVIYAVNNTYNIVNSSGVQILVFLAALQSISPSIFEASKVEGASKWEEFWKITFPIITPMIFVNIVYTIIDSFTNPIYGIMAYIRNQAFGAARIGYASALSWIYFMVILLILGLSSWIFSRRMTYLEN